MLILNFNGKYAIVRNEGGIYYSALFCFYAKATSQVHACMDLATARERVELAVRVSSRSGKSLVAFLILFCYTSAYYGIEWERLVLMNDKVEVLGISIDHMNVETAMQRIADFLRTDSLNTVGIITMNALLIAAEDPVHREYLEQLDLSVVGELEVLEAAGINSGQIYEETKENDFIARMFWKLISNRHTFFLLGESDEEVDALTTYVQETYPDIIIRGKASGIARDERSADWIVNEINGSGADVIISGLQGFSQSGFLLENKMKINGKIWICLGEHINIQNEAGIKNTWFSTLLKKSTFKRMAAKYRNEEID